MVNQKLFLFAAAAVFFAAVPPSAKADTFDLSFAGPGVSGTVALVYGTSTDKKYAQAFEVTGISGTFSDAKLGLSNVSITGLQPINHATPQPANTLAPDDFSRFAVASGLPPVNHGTLTFDNLLYPGGSPHTGSDYPFFGGVFDVYGLLFDIGGGRVVDLWSNGVLPGSTSADYGVSVASSQAALDYVGSRVTLTPEPGTLGLLGTGLLTLLWRRPSLRRAQS